MHQSSHARISLRDDGLPCRTGGSLFSWPNAIDSAYFRTFDREIQRDRQSDRTTTNNENINRFFHFIASGFATLPKSKACAEFAAEIDADFQSLAVGSTST
jgi:hypothetical protein